MHRVGLQLLFFVWVAGCAVSAAGQVDAGASGAAHVPTMVFDVASVRQSKVDMERGYTVIGEFTPVNSCHLRMQNFELRNLIMFAYPVDWTRLDGLQKMPKDMLRCFFDVSAKCDPETEERLAKLGKKECALEQEHMVAAMLAERFNLKVHWETRDGKTYDLIVSKTGRLHTTGEPPTAAELASFGERGVPPIHQHGDTRSGYEWIAHGATTTDIAQIMGGQFGHPVVDKTGLTGKYDFRLKTYGVRASDRRDSDANAWPPLDNAMEDQLGLKLVAAHGPIQILVIDHVEMPSEN